MISDRTCGNCCFCKSEDDKSLHGICLMRKKDVEVQKNFLAAKLDCKKHLYIAGKEHEKMNLSQIKERYEGIQTKLNAIDSDGCLFLCLCSIIEEVTDKPADIIGIVQESTAKGWIGKEFYIKDSCAILSHFTGKKFKRERVLVLPTFTEKNEFSIEKWFTSRTGFTHFRRRFVDTLASSVTVNEGRIYEYYIYSY